MLTTSYPRLPNVLIVYENFLFRKTTQQILQPHCNHVYTAHDMDSTLLCLTTAVNEDRPIDVIILDEFLVFLPNTRVTLICFLRKTGYAGKLWIATGMHYAHDVAVYLSMGANGLLFKPYESSSLISAVKHS